MRLKRGTSRLSRNGGEDESDAHEGGSCPKTGGMAATVDLAHLCAAPRPVVQLSRYLACGACSSISTFAPPTRQVRSVRLLPANSRGIDLCVDPFDHHMGSVGPMDFQEGQLRNKEGQKTRSSPVTPSPFARGWRKLRRLRPTRSIATRAYHSGPSTRRTRGGFETSRSSSTDDGALISEVTDMRYTLGQAWSLAAVICANPIAECRS